MTNRAPKLLLDAINAIEAAQEFLGQGTLADYAADRMRRSAVERQLEILGEAGARLLKLDPGWATHVPALKLAAGLRNRIIHGYDAVDDELVFLTVRDDLGPLKQALVQQLENLG